MHDDSRTYVLGSVQKSVLDPVLVGTTAGIGANTIEPIYKPEMLTALFYESAHLRPPVAAMAANIDAMGHRLVPIVDVNDPGAEETIATALLVETGTAPTRKAIASALAALAEKQRVERLLLAQWFRFASVECTWTEVRRRTRMDLEITGNAYWEVVRDDETSEVGDLPIDDSPVQMRRIKRIRHLRSHEMRVARSDGALVDVVSTVRSSPIDVDTQVDRRCVHRYHQRVGTTTRWYKTLGDQRVVSSRTGRAYESVDAMTRAEPDATPATEVVHHVIYDPRSVYGSPRWVGALKSVVGSNAADEVNLDYFSSKPPAGMLLVTGGKLKKDTVARLETLWAAHARSRSKFHGLVVVEAMDGGFAPQAAGTGTAAIKFQPLTGTQTSDGLFREYDAANANKIGRCFRLPPILRGDVADVNRATAQTAVSVADEQVFADERRSFDALMSDIILPQAGFHTMEFQTHSPAPSADPIELIGALVTLREKAPELLDVAEIRSVLATALSIDLEQRDVEPVGGAGDLIRSIAALIKSDGGRTITRDEIRALLGPVIKQDLRP